MWVFFLQFKKEKNLLTFHVKRTTYLRLKSPHYLFAISKRKIIQFFFLPNNPPVLLFMLLIGYINLVWYEWGMLRCCQVQSSPLFTNSLRSIDAGLLRGNDNINQSLRHNGPNQPEITGNVTMSYVSVAGAIRWICPAVEKKKGTGESNRSSCHYLLWFFSALFPEGNLSIRVFLLSRSCSASKQLSCDHSQNKKRKEKRKHLFSVQYFPHVRFINTVRSEVPRIHKCNLLYSW